LGCCCPLPTVHDPLFPPPWMGAEPPGG
jgi:hypothetical protein